MADVNADPNVWEVITRAIAGNGSRRYEVSGTAYAIQLSAMESQELGTSKDPLPYVDISFDGNTDVTFAPEHQRVRLYLGHTLEVPTGFRVFTFKFGDSANAGSALVLRVSKVPGLGVGASDMVRIAQDPLRPLNVAGPPGDVTSGAITSPGANAIVTGADTFGLSVGYHELIVDLSTTDTGKEMVVAHRNAANTGDVRTMRFVLTHSPYRAQWPAYLFAFNERIVVRVGATPTAGSLYTAAIYWRRVGRYVEPV